MGSRGVPQRLPAAAFASCPICGPYRLTERFRGATEETALGSAFQPIGVSPPYRDWFGDAGWTTFTFEQRDLDNQTRSEALGVAGNLQGDYGIFRISGDGQYEKDSSYKKVDETRLEFSCQLMRVTLDRPWMNPLVLSSRAWRWARGTPLYGTKYSTGGDIADGVPPAGTMTVIPTAAILSKNLIVKGTFEDTVVNELNNLIKANASVGIGPFAVAGQFNMEDHTGSIAGTIATNGIQAEDVQIIALVCQMLPECPNPDPTLDWPA